MPTYSLPLLPLTTDLQTKAVLLQLNKSSRALAELKGEVKTIPNERILINTLGLQEAKDSSAVENIITTNDELFRAGVDKHYVNPAAKEVQYYVTALIRGFEEVRTTGLLTNRTIKEIQRELEHNNAGFRELPGTTLKNNLGEVVYEPPQERDEVLHLMTNLEQYINDPAIDELDPLIRMAVIHHQFESIHPFYDGNGRTGRIINILYLVKEGLLDIPVLYLSHFIIQHKQAYYHYLQSVRETGNWEAWVLYILKGVEETAYQTITLVQAIRHIMNDYKTRMRQETSFYRKELLENLFQHPYTKISFVEQVLGVHRNTASAYLTALTELGLTEKVKLGRSNYYINVALFDLLRRGLSDID
jgi:Fic family protein